MALSPNTFFILDERLINKRLFRLLLHLEKCVAMGNGLYMQSLPSLVCVSWWSSLGRYISALPLSRSQK